MDLANYIQLAKSKTDEDEQNVCTDISNKNKKPISTWTYS